MERAMLEQHLAQAERHVAQGERLVREQRDRLLIMQRDGHDASEAEKLLAQLEEIQALHVSDRDRVRRELDAAP